MYLWCMSLSVHTVQLQSPYSKRRRNNNYSSLTLLWILFQIVSLMCIDDEKGLDYGLLIRVQNFNFLSGFMKMVLTFSLPKQYLLSRWYNNSKECVFFQFLYSLLLCFVLFWIFFFYIFIVWSDFQAVRCHKSKVCLVQKE